MEKMRISVIFMGLCIGIFIFPKYLGAYEARSETHRPLMDDSLKASLDIPSREKKEAPSQTNESSNPNDPDGAIELQIRVKEPADVLEDFVEDENDFPAANLVDPFENFNRTMYKINDALYENVMEPAATVYSEVTDSDFRGIVSSFFENLTMPIQLVSSILQGDANKAGRSLVRFLINSTLGSGGMVDVAKTEFHIEKVDENFEQALGFHGVKSGPYLVLPLMGPSTFRGTAGKFIDGFLNPARFFMAPAPVVNFGINVGRKINETAMSLDVKKEIEDIAIDPYLCVRDLYMQHTRAKIQE